MKKIILTLATIATLALTARAAVVILVGSGVNIPATTITNFSTTVQVGTFTLSPQYAYLANAGIWGTTNNVVVEPALSFDGTNKFFLPQTYMFPSTNATSSALFAVTNITLPVFGMITVSNGNSSTLTNLNIAIQQ